MLESRRRRRTVLLSIIGVAAFIAVVIAVVMVLRQRQAASAAADVAPVRAIEPPLTPLPAEAESAGVTRFSFIAYGDVRGRLDGEAPQANHGRVVDEILARVKALAGTDFPVRFVVQSGDCVKNGRLPRQWNISFTPVVEKLTRAAGLPYFVAIGNHDVPGAPDGTPDRATGLHNALNALARLIPPEGTARRLDGYPTYAIGYGNAFVVLIDSNIADDPVQAAWVKDQLEHLDRSRYRHVIAVFHHPVYSSGPHGFGVVEPPTAALRAIYLPLFRKHHVRMTIAGHEHLFEHWVEHYDDGGKTYRRDDLVSGGGGAPTYAYKGDPDLSDYLAGLTAQGVRVEHLVKPGPEKDDNPHHFLVVQIDGDRLSVEVVAVGSTELKPYDGSASVALADPP